MRAEYYQQTTDNRKQKIIEETHCVAMRGRNPEHPTDRTPGIHTEQRLEMNKDGLVNTLTTVQKDNLLLEAKTIRMVRTEEVKEKMKNIVIDIYNNKIIDDEVCGTITAHGNASFTTCGTFGIVEKEKKIQKVGQISSDGSEYGTVISENGLSSTLAAGTHGYCNNCIQQAYRIRKLTPKECWRLMGYTDKDFEKAAEVNSNTQLYRESGNAIVKQVMMAIFLQMGIKGLKKWEERSEEEKAELIRGSIYDKADFQ